MTLKIEELQYLVDATGTEMDAVKGGYAATVARITGNIGLASIASGIVSGRSAFDPSVVTRQLQIGVPGFVVALGTAAAITAGRGRYTIPVTAAKLEG